MKKLLFLFLLITCSTQSCTVVDTELLELVLEIKNQNQELLEEVKALQAKSDSLINELKNSAAKQEEVLKKVTDLQAELVKVLAQIGTLNEQLGAQNADLDEIKSQLADLQEKYQGILEQLEQLQKLSQILAEIEKLKGQLAELDGKYQVIQGSLTQNKEQLDALKSQVASLQAQLAENLTKISQLTSQLGEQGADIEKILAAIEELKKSCAEIKSLLENQLSGKSPIPTNGLVGWWPFNGNANDESGNGKNGTFVGNPNLTLDRFGKSNSSFQAGSSYVVCPTSVFQFSPSQAFTVSTWFTADPVLSSGRMLSNENPEGNFRIGKYNSNRIAVQFGDYILFDVTNNEWHNLVYTYDNKNEKVYIDGKLVATNIEAANETFKYGAPFTIGAKAAPAYDKWAGKIDDVAIWNRILTADEISKIYKGEGF